VDYLEVQRHLAAVVERVDVRVAWRRTLARRGFRVRPRGAGRRKDVVRRWSREGGGGRTRGRWRRRWQCNAAAGALEQKLQRVLSGKTHKGYLTDMRALLLPKEILLFFCAIILV
jgi:hypothetical protein